MVKGDVGEDKRQIRLADDGGGGGIEPSGLRSPPRARIIAPGIWLRREVRIVDIGSDA